MKAKASVTGGPQLRNAQRLLAFLDEDLGDIVLSLAPLTRHRNEMVHQYLKINWQNILAVKQKIDTIRAFGEKVKAHLAG